MNHGKGHFHTFHHLGLGGWIFQINTPVMNHGKGRLSHLVRWFSCLPFRLWTISHCRQPMQMYQEPAGAMNSCNPQEYSPNTVKVTHRGCVYQVTLGRTCKSMMVLILKDWGNEMPQEHGWTIQDGCHSSIWYRRFYSVFLLIQAKFDGWRQLLCGLYPFIRFPPKMAHCSRMSQIVTP